MTYIVQHNIVGNGGPVSVERSEIIAGKGEATVSFSLSGSFRIQFPGKLQILTRATYGVQDKIPTDLGGTGNWESKKTVALPLKLEIRKPDGTLFTGDHITLNDLNEFRDLRGTSREEWKWTYHLHGEAGPFEIDIKSSRIFEGTGFIRIGIEETVTSKSAPPLVTDTLLTNSGRRYEFDLFRVGTFTATAPNRGMVLFEPDGNAVATRNGHLTFPVTLETLDKSRDATGNPRLWSLEILPFHLPTMLPIERPEGEEPDPNPKGPTGGIPTTVFASVIETARIRTSVLNERINKLIGEGDSQLSIFGEMTDSDSGEMTDSELLLVRLKINDDFTAETIDMHGLIDHVIKSVKQDPGINTKNIQIERNVIYNLYRHKRVLASSNKLDTELKVSDFKMRISAIKIGLGASKKIQPPIPALAIDVAFDQASISVATRSLGHELELATAKIRDNLIHLEAGLRLNADGSFSAETWIQEDLIDIDVDKEAVVAAMGLDLLNPIFGVLEAGAMVIAVGEAVEKYTNDLISESFRIAMSGIVAEVPQILARILGDDFTYRSVRLAGDDIVFDYIAPLESEPKPSKNYTGVIGRSAIQENDDPPVWSINPPLLGDTWSTQNLINKIDHIVVVMMENRSFDHVLGYRAQLPEAKGSDGLTEELIRSLESLNPKDLGYPEAEKIQVRKLNHPDHPDSEFEPKTKIPYTVGHDLDDVAQQLKEMIKIPSGRFINSPKGFIDNFVQRHELTWPRNQLVMGYYEAKDLPFFDFLAKNYAYCESFYSSHPGPTLPNRMFLLTGDVQYDRTGEAILNNNNSDNFTLSRSLTIFDVLKRKGVSWRVYESFPSVTMLRMFARYATDNINIVDISRLGQDVKNGNLPAVTFIEPAMHHFPQNDDHAPADMYHGQLFLQDVYDALRTNEELWRKTMLVITYDEHGGFYDHVIPPIADILTRTLKDGVPDIHSGGAPFTPFTMAIKYGVRVPTFIVSPWAPAGKGPNITLDFCSILKTIIARFCGQSKPFVSDRVNASMTLDAYLTEAQPRMNVQDISKLPPLMEQNPHPEQSIITDVISRELMRSGKVDYHDLTGMLARLLGR